MAGVRLIGTAQHKASVLSFLIEGVHPHDVGTIFDQQGVAIRSGPSLCPTRHAVFWYTRDSKRASFAFYNTMEEVDALAAAVKSKSTGAICLMSGQQI